MEGNCTGRSLSGGLSSKKHWTSRSRSISSRSIDEARACGRPNLLLRTESIYRSSPVKKRALQVAAESPGTNYHTRHYGSSGIVLFSEEEYIDHLPLDAQPEVMYHQSDYISGSHSGVVTSSHQTESSSSKHTESSLSNT